MASSHESSAGAFKMIGEADVSKFFSALKVPALPGLEAFVDVQRRNLEVLSAANRIAIEGAQTVAKRHMEIIQQTMADLSTTVKALAAAHTPQEKAATQAELFKTNYEKAIANVREISDIIQKSNAEAMGLLHQRVAASVDEVKVLIAKSPAGG